MTRNSQLARRAQLAVVVATALVLLLRFTASAWISEDAHITLRTVENFVEGFGLRWNVDERVQTYTHPLWLLLVSGVRLFTRETYFTLTAVGLACSVGAYAAVAWHFRRKMWVLLAGVFAPWLFSPSLVRYGTSGFENPLTLLLLALFAVTLMRDGKGGTPWLRLCGIAALGAVNRLDAILLYAPALAALAVLDLRSVPWRRVALGFFPLAAWMLFSLLYYGFVFPNTAYAKLSSAIPRQLYLSHGVRYLADLVVNDPVAIVLLAAGVAASGTSLARARADREDTEAARLASLGGGALLYCGYVVWIGGDFLSGRFWVAPVLLSLVVFATELPRFVRWLKLASLVRGAGVVLLVAALLMGARGGAQQALEKIPGRSRPLSRGHVHLEQDLTWQVTNEGAYFRWLGRGARKRAEAGGPRIQVLSVIGLAGLAAGRDVIIVDLQALGDPLLARLPPARIDQLKIGHLVRRLPAGYLQARETGSLAAMDPGLARYYEKLRLVTSGPLLNGERLATILGFQLGAYDEWLDAYLKKSARRAPVR